MSADRAAWLAAETFDELCELGARFVEGRIAHFPGWLAGEVDEESEALAGTLAALNRRGFLTTASQPGHAARVEGDGCTWRRRAFVMGFAGPALARRFLSAAAAGADEFVAACYGPSGAEGAAEAVPVAVRGEETVLVCGHDAREEELALFEGDVSESALRELRDTCFVGLHAPTWGPGEALWRRLLDA